MAKRLWREASEETRILQSIRKQGVMNPNYNKERSEETKEKISQKMKQYWAGIPSKNDNETI